MRSWPEGQARARGLAGRQGQSGARPGRTPKATWCFNEAPGSALQLEVLLFSGAHANAEAPWHTTATRSRQRQLELEGRSDEEGNVELIDLPACVHVPAPRALVGELGADGGRRRGTC